MEQSPEVEFFLNFLHENGRLPSHTVVATRTFTGLKPSISPSNVALNSNPGTVLETARPEDSKTPPTC